jgi:hypothetical protein
MHEGHACEARFVHEKRGDLLFRLGLGRTPGLHWTDDGK